MMLRKQSYPNSSCSAGGNGRERVSVCGGRSMTDFALQML